MDIKTLRELIHILNDEKLTEITVTDGNERITVKREPAAMGSPHGAPALAASPERAANDEKLFELTAPLVGTFYRKQAPGGPLLVEIGDHVRAGATLCIIEAMKVMNEISAERSGILRAVLTQDGAPVEFGQPLFQFEADGESISRASEAGEPAAEQTSPASAL